MGHIDFSVINDAALFRCPSILECWLPGGRVSGDEYECGDLSGGAGKSCKVNTSTGKWADFAANQSGGDLISLYAAINGLDQGTAAKQLADDFGISRPSQRQSSKKQKWTAQPFSPSDAPAPDFNHWKHGNPAAKWEYRDEQNRLIGYVCRFNTETGKEIIPMTWAVGELGDRCWRWLSFVKPRPLYNLPSLSRYPDANVIIVEGEKCADALQSLFDNLSIEIPVVSWPGGGKATKHAEFKPLAGRKVAIWPDHDTPGYATARDVLSRLKKLDCNASILTPPQEKPDTWDCADWITETPDLTADDVLQFLRDGMARTEEAPPPIDATLPSAPPDTEENTPIDFSDCPFQFLGYDRGVYYYLSRNTKQVIELKAEAHQGRSLYQLAPLSWWERKFPGARSSVNWDAAADWMIFESTAAGIFNASRIRGRGAWEDNNRSVLHTGDSLIVDGQRMPIDDHETRYVYEIGQALDHQVGTNQLTNKQANEFAKICERLSWTKPINGALLSGWCVLAPICGALRWRPHVWVTGSKGTGKSWILENVIKPAVGGTALGVTSSTTEAGIRQTLRNDARPVVFDEAEGEDKNSQKRLQSVLELARQASSEAAAAIFKGTANGRAMSFSIRSCFLFASIGVTIHQDSDASRITVLSLQQDRSDDSSDKFEQLKTDLFRLLTPEYCANLRARSVNLIPTIRQNAETFARAAAEHFGSQRTGDQIGSLLAGYYSLFRTDIISFERAREWVAERKSAWDEIAENSGDDSSDEMRCLYSILSHTVKVQGRHRSIDMSLGGVLSIALGCVSEIITRDEAEEIVKNHGLRPDTFDGFFVVSNNDPRIKKILKDTPWSSGWAQLLQRIDGAEKRPPITFSPGVRSRGIVLPARLLEDDQSISEKNYATECTTEY